MGEKKNLNRRELADNQKTIININEYVRFINHAGTEFELQKKNNYTDGSDNWIFDGWLYSEDTLMKAARNIIRDRKVKKKEEADLTYFIECFKEADKEIKEFFKA
jgi:hypothetical protein